MRKVRLGSAIKALFVGFAVLLGSTIALPAQAAADPVTVTITNGAGSSPNFTQTYGTSATVTVSVSNAVSKSVAGVVVTLWPTNTVGTAGQEYGTCTMAANAGTSASCNVSVKTNQPASASTVNMYAITTATTGANSLAAGVSGVKTLLVNKANITYTVAAPSAINYGAAAPSYAVTSSGFRTGETFSVVPACGAHNPTSGYVAGVAPTFYSVSGGIGSDAGSYRVSCSAGTLPNSTNYQYLASSAITAASGNGSAVTFTAANTFTVGQLVTITGASPASFNLSKVLITSASATQFTVVSTVTDTWVSGGVATFSGFSTANTTATITNASGTGSLVTYTAANSFSVGQFVTITGVSPIAYNLSNVEIVTASSTSFTVRATPNSAFVSGGTATAGAFTVNKLSAAVTVASPSAIAYGDAVPVISHTFTPVASVNLDTLTLNCSTNYTQWSLPNTYATTCAVDDPLAGKNRNYNISITNGSLVVNKRGITLTATSRTVTYGAADPVGSVLGTDYTVPVDFPVGNSDTWTTVPTCSTLYTSTTPVSLSGIAINCSAALDTAKFTLTNNAGSVTINRKALEVVADSYSVHYGDASPVALRGYTLTSGKDFINGDTFTTEPSCTSLYTVTTGIASTGISVNCSSAVQNNYNISYVAGAITISAATVTVTPNAKSVQYGAAVPTYDYVATGFKNSETFSTTPTCTSSYSVTTGVASSPLTISCSGGAKINYIINTDATATVTIAHRDLVVTAKSYTKTYGDAAPDLSASNGFTVAGFQNGETFSVVPTCSSAYSNITHVAASPVTVSCSSASASENYNLSYVAGAVTINRAAISATIESFTVTYGDAIPSYSFTSTAFISNANNDGFLVTPSCSSAYSRTSNVGSYAITCDLQVSSDYSLSTNSASVTVNSAALEVVADSYSVHYGDTSPVLTHGYTFTVSKSFLNGDTFTTQPTCSSAYTTTTGVASSGITVTCSGGVQSNYTISYVAGAITISAATVTVSATPVTIQYYDAVPEYTFSEVGFKNGETYATAPICISSYTQGTAVASSPLVISCSGADKINYVFIYVDANLTITKRHVVVTGHTYNYTYGDAAPDLTGSNGFTSTGWLNGDTFLTIPTCTTAYTHLTHVSSSPVAIVCSGADADASYILDYHDGAVNIAKYDITATIASFTVTYGDAAPSYTFSHTGFVSNDNADGFLVSPSCSSTYTRTASVGSYPVTCNLQVSGDYNLITNSATVTVNQAALQVVADSYTVHYGDTSPVLNHGYTFTTGKAFLNGDSFTTQPTCSSLYTVTTGVSSSGIAVNCSGGVQSNYSITYLAGSITIRAATVTVTPYGKSVTYADAVPTYDFTYTGFKNSETFSTQPTCSSAYTDTTSFAASPLTISCSGAVKVNYIFDLKTATLTISKKLVTVTGKSYSLTYGDAAPNWALSNAFTASGFAHGETFNSNPSCTTAYTNSTHVASSPVTVTCSSATTSVDYTVTYVDGHITIAKASVTATVDAKTVKYGDAIPAYTYSANFVVNSNNDNFTTDPGCNSAFTHISDVGTYPITCNFTVSADYNLTVVNASVTANPAPLVVKGKTETVQYGDAYTPSAVAVGFVNGDTYSTAPTCTDANSLSAAYTVTSPVGSGPYTVTCSGAARANYSITYETGIMTLVNKDLYVTANSFNLTYGSSIPTFSYTHSAFNNLEYFDTEPTCAETNYSNIAGSRSQVGASVYTRCSGAALPNYNFIYVDGVITIQKREVIITADDYAVTYGDELSSYSYKSINGLVDAGLSGISCTSDYVAGTHVSASPRSVNCSATPNGNYFVTYVAGNVTISKYNLTITANNVTVTYGAAISYSSDAPTYLASYYSSAISDYVYEPYVYDPLCGSVYTRYANVGLGSYAIFCTATASADYSISFVNGALTVNKKALSISAKPITLTYGDAVPSYQYYAPSGLVNGDTLTTNPTCGSAYTTTTSIPGTDSTLVLTITCSGAVQANYTITYNTANLTVNKRVAYYTSSGSTVYGSAEPALTVTPSGLVNGDTLATLGTCHAAAYAPGQPAGPYEISCTGVTASNNYDLRWNLGYLNITKARLTITANHKTITYGDVAGTLGFTPTGFYSNETFSDNAMLTPTCTAATYSQFGNIGDYVISCTGSATSFNYTISYVSGLLTVDPLNLTVTAATPLAITYGANAPASYSYLPVAFVNSENFSTVPTCTSDYTKSAASPYHHAGTYDVTCSGGVKANYTFTYVKTSLLVNKKALALGVQDITLTYGTTMTDPSPVPVGFINGDQFTTAAVCDSKAYKDDEIENTFANVGEYAINCTGYSQADYDITFTPGKVTVNPYGVTVTAQNETKVYGSTAPTYTYSTTGFLKPNVLTTEPTCTSTYGVTTGVGTVPIVCASGNAGANYHLTYVDGVMTITKKALLVTADDISAIYGETPVYTSTPTGFINGDHYGTAPTCAHAAWSVTTGVGNSYVIECAGASQANYNIAYATGHLTVTARTLTVTANDRTVTYGDAAPSYDFRVSNLINSDTFSTTPTCTSSYSTATKREQLPVTINCDLGAMANYTMNYVAGHFTINKKAISVTYNDTFYYGTAAGYVAQVTGLINSDVYSVAPACVSSYLVTSPIGTYSTSCSGGTVSESYVASYAPGQITVNKRPLIITANDVNRTYGETKPDVYTYSINGLQNGELLTRNATCASNYNSLTHAGVNPTISCSGATASSNYVAPQFVNGRVIVAKRNLYIAATSAIASYGSTPRAHTYNVSGFVNGEWFTGALPSCVSGFTSTTPVGTYPIACSGGVMSDYNNIYTPSYLEVFPKKLTVAALTATINYGDATPALTYAATGWAPGDSFVTAPSCFTFYNSTTPVGVYENYTLCKGGVQPNYDIRYVTGTITVVPRKLTVVATNLATTYGTIPNYRFTATGFANGDSFSVSPTCTSIYGEVGHRAVGTYDITCSGGSANNYWLKFNDGTLTVTAASLVVSAVDKTINYGSAIPTYNFTTSGFFWDDNFSSRPYCSSVYTSRSPVNYYLISCAGGKATNYLVNYVYGSLTVVPRPMVLTVDNRTVSYGDELGSITFTTSNMVNSDTLTVQPNCSTIYTKYADYTPAGFSISCSGAEQNNYSITYVSGHLTMQRRVINIVPDTKNIFFGASVPTYTWTTDSLTNGDTWTTEPTCTSNYQVSSAAGNWPIFCDYSLSDNYEVRVASAYVAVTKKALTLTAKDKTYNYGDRPTIYEYEATGFAAGDDFTINPRCYSAYTSTSPVLAGGATYSVLCDSYIASNYSITFVPGKVTVNPLALTVTADDQSVTYGDAAPANYGYTYSGFLAGETFTTLPTCTSTYSSTSPAGQVAINCSGGVQGNYAITYVPGKVVVAKHALTITADNKQVTYGDPAPTYTFNTSGFVNGDAFGAGGLTAPSCAAKNPAGSITYTAKSPAGQYSIECSNAVVGNNYSTPTYVPATLQVDRVATTLTVANITKTYGEAVPTSYDYTWTGNLSGDVLTTAPSCSTNYTTNSQITDATHTYSITCTGAANPNYFITLVPGAVTVNKRTLTLKGVLDQSTIQYGMPKPTTTWDELPVGFVNGESFGSFGYTKSDIVCSTSYDPSVVGSGDAGTYAVTCSSPALLNYTVTSALVNLNVIRKSINVSAKVTDNNGKNITSVAYYGDILTSSYIATGFLPGEDYSVDIKAVCSAPVKSGSLYYVSCAVSSTDRQAFMDAHKNYVITDTLSPVYFSVNARPVTIRAKALTITAGETPTYDFTIENALDGESAFLALPACSSPYDSNKVRGTGSYVITCTATTSNAAKFQVVIVTATLTVKSSANTVASITALGDRSLTTTTAKEVDWYKNQLANFNVAIGTIPDYARVSVAFMKTGSDPRCATASTPVVTGATNNWNIKTDQMCELYTLVVTVTAENDAVKTYIVAFSNPLPIFYSTYAPAVGKFILTKADGTPYVGTLAATGTDATASLAGDISSTLTMFKSSDMQLSNAVSLSTSKLICKTGYYVRISIAAFSSSSNIAGWIKWGNTAVALTPVNNATYKTDGFVVFELPAVPTTAGTAGIIQITGLDSLNVPRTIAWGVTS